MINLPLVLLLQVKYKLVQLGLLKGCHERMESIKDGLNQYLLTCLPIMTIIVCFLNTFCNEKWVLNPVKKKLPFFIDI